MAIQRFEIRYTWVHKKSKRRIDMAMVVTKDQLPEAEANLRMQGFDVYDYYPYIPEEDLNENNKQKSASDSAR